MEPPIVIHTTNSSIAIYHHYMIQTHTHIHTLKNDWEVPINTSTCRFTPYIIIDWFDSIVQKWHITYATGKIMSEARDKERERVNGDRNSSRGVTCIISNFTCTCTQNLMSRHYIVYTYIPVVDMSLRFQQENHVLAE